MDAFTIASWPVESQVTLTRVAWDSSYRDVVRFENEAERAAYFAGLDSDAIKLDRMTYLKPGEPIRINIPFSACYNYNYLVVDNPALPVPGEEEPPRLYYFITSVAFKDPNCSVLTVQLDVFQTYLFDFELGQCFLERGHYPMSKSHKETTFVNEVTGDVPNIWSDTLRKYLLAPEGLDVGNEYMIGTQEYRDLANIDPAKSQTTPWMVVIMATTDLESDFGNVSKPNLDTANGGVYDGLASGANVYMCDADRFSAFMSTVAKAPWVASGILSITAYPTWAFGKHSNFFGAKLGGKDFEGFYKVADIATDSIHPEFKFEPIQKSLTKAIYNSATVAAEYSHFLKLYTYPYSVIELSNRSGNTLILKPELLNDFESPLEFYGFGCAVPGNMRLCLCPKNYAEAVSDTQTYKYSTMAANDLNGRISGYSTDVAIWFDNFPQFPLVNDNYMMYLASSTNTRNWQYSAAGWSNAKANMSIDTSQAVAMNNLATAQANQQIGLGMGAFSTGMGAVGNLMGGNVLGAGATLLSGGVSLVGGNMQFENTQAAQLNAINANASLARTTAAGDYEQAIRGIEATVQDAALTQPSTVGSAGGNGFNFANGLMGLAVRYKVPSEKYIKSLCNFWGRFGYAYNEYVKPPRNLKMMKHFTYWKMKDTYITASKADEGVKQTLRGIFERGVTVWSNPNEIGKINPLINYE